MSTTTKFMKYISIFVVFITLSYGCISSGNDDLSEKHIEELKSKNADVVLNERFIETYLKTFGYLQDPPNVKELDNLAIKNANLQTALKSFQQFMNIPPNGIIDTKTSVAMMRKRCSNKDHSSEINSIWEKSVLTFNITNIPKTIKENEFREILHQSFNAWEIVIPIDFVEVNDANKADIIFIFQDPTYNWENDPTHLGIAGATGPLQSKIWLSTDEEWDSNNELDTSKIDLYNVLVHEIGHVLGLRHSTDIKSIMHPLFERSNNNENKNPEVTSDDVEKLRNLYQIVDIDTRLSSSEINELKNTELLNSGIIKGISNKCPLILQTITKIDNNYLIFNDNKIWKTLNKSIISESMNISDIFQFGPEYVNTSSIINDLIILIQNREIYGYIKNNNGNFTLAPNYPKQLHERVLFYPEASFTLSNGSLILLSDNVFATYDIENNVPTFLHDKNIYFPNLPDELRSGIPLNNDNYDIYHMFTSDTVYQYDMRIQQIIDSQSLSTFFKCDL